jgi:phage repressor protein C with HTH and peptisase S24 domain
MNKNNGHAHDFDASKRLKYIRSSLLRVTRIFLQEKYALPEVTLKSWENGTTKLTLSGVKRCIEIFRQEGVLVSPEWILEGVGFEPKMINTINTYFSIPVGQPQSLPTEDDELFMMKEANHFKEIHSNAVIMIVSNDDMRPAYLPGSYVGGKLRTGSEIDSSINKDCIIFLKNGGQFFRRLIKNSIGQYNLVCLNPHETTAEPVLYNVDIESVAPIIWHRWKDNPE